MTELLGGKALVGEKLSPGNKGVVGREKGK
jgi:hypothetical protein